MAPRLGLRGVLLSLGIAGIMALNAVAYLHVRAMTHFVPGGVRTAFPEQLSIPEKLWVLLTGVTVPRPTNSRTPSGVGLPHEDWEFRCSDGTRLASWYIAAADSKITILMLHGYAGSREALIDEAKVLYSMGYSLVLLDFRGSGESEGSSTTIGVDEARDVQAAIAEIGRRTPDQAVVLLGQSMGAAAALRAVSLGLASPDGLILEAPFDRMLTTVANWFTAMGLPSWPFANLLLYWGGWLIGSDAFAHNPADYAINVKCPTIVISGGLDRRVRPAEAQAVYSGLGGWKRIKLFDDVGHLMYTKRHLSEWKTLVSEVLAQVAEGRRNVVEKK